jgi:PAS domain S-box-containing protein
MKSNGRGDVGCALEAAVSEHGLSQSARWKDIEHLLEPSGALIAATDAQRKIRLFSDLFSSLTGWSKKEVVGSDLLCLVPQSERARVAPILTDLLRGQPTSPFETAIADRDGREISLSLACSPFWGSQGEVEGLIVIGQDLTSFKQLEQRIIHVDRLAFLGRFAASVAHEINNPLSAVVSYADALLARSIHRDGPDEEKLRRILDGCERILRFTRQLVSYARPADECRQRAALNELVETALSYCDHVVRHYGIRVEQEYQGSAEVPAIKANLVQVFVNLITNACQAMEVGGTLRVSTCQEGATAMVRVSDNGVGMDSRTLERLFEPFYTTKLDGTGSGLGLCIAQSIVHQHGGSIEVQSALGAGTTFLVRLPSRSASEAIAESINAAPLGSRAATC